MLPKKSRFFLPLSMLDDPPKKKGDVNRLKKFPLLTAQQIEDSPTKNDGWDQSKESGLRKKAACKIYDTCEKHRMYVFDKTHIPGVLFLLLLSLQEDGNGGTCSDTVCAILHTQKHAKKPSIRKYILSPLISFDCS